MQEDQVLRIYFVILAHCVLFIAFVIEMDVFIVEILPSEQLFILMDISNVPVEIV